MTEQDKDRLTIPENVKNEILVEAVRTIDTLRKIRTKILSSDESERQRLLKISSDFAKEVSSRLADYLFTQDGSSLNEARSLVDEFIANSDTDQTNPTVSYASDSLSNRQFKTKFLDICSNLENGFFGLAWKVFTKNINGMRVEPQDLEGDDVLVVSPLSTGIVLTSLWSEILLRLNKIQKPLNIQTSANAPIGDEVYHQTPDIKYSRIYILDDTIPYAKKETGTVARTHQALTKSYHAASVKSAFSN